MGSDAADPTISNSFGEDMLQMAFTMASGFPEPPVDLEGALVATTITAPQQVTETSEETIVPHPLERQQSKRGRRPSARLPKTYSARRGRRPMHHIEPIPIPEPEEPLPPPEPIEKPDAHMCLKVKTFHMFVALVS